MNFKILIKKQLANWLGINIIKVPRTNASLLKNRLLQHPVMGYVYEQEARLAMQVVSSNTMLTYQPLISLYEQVIYCEKNNIEGDFVECGTWKGGATGMMALANLKFGKQRRHLHLFDAFEEICQPDDAFDDKQLIDEVKKIAGIKEFEKELKPIAGVYNQFGGPGTLQENKHLLETTIRYPNNFLHYHIGWFQNTVPADAHQISTIAILRLDGDWYQSTKVCLDYLFEKVTKNGIIIIDDYGYNTGCKKAVDDFLEQQNCYPIINYISDACRYFIKL